MTALFSIGLYVSSENIKRSRPLFSRFCFPHLAFNFFFAANFDPPVISPPPYNCWLTGADKCFTRSQPLLSIVFRIHELVDAHDKLA